MVAIPFSWRRRKQKSGVLPGRDTAPSILDLPFSAYDPVTHLPTSVRIGETSVHPLVSIQELKDHLVFLAAVLELSRAQDADFGSYLLGAAERYVLWAHSLPALPEDRRLPSSQSSRAHGASVAATPAGQTHDGDVNGDAVLAFGGMHGDGDGGLANCEDAFTLPSLDILACWHSHMLNPKLYVEECGREYPGLRGRRFPLGRVAAAIRNRTLQSAASTSLRFPSPSDERSIQTDLLPDLSDCKIAKQPHLAIDASATPGSTGLAHPQPATPSLWGPQDIADAVQRQMKFVENMSRIGWLESERWERDVEELQRGDVRYHAYLDLHYSTSGKAFLVPTLDIDLAWHTHQLHGEGYMMDVTRLLGWVLGHDDTPGEGVISDGLEKTERLWREKFEWGYVY